MSKTDSIKVMQSDFFREQEQQVCDAKFPKLDSCYGKNIGGGGDEILSEILSGGCTKLFAI